MFEKKYFKIGFSFGLGFLAAFLLGAVAWYALSALAVALLALPWGPFLPAMAAVGILCFLGGGILILAALAGRLSGQAIERFRLRRALRRESHP